MMVIVSLLMVKLISWCVDMIKKLYAISVYDYVDMLCEETGSEWNNNNVWFITKKHLYNDKDNSKHIEKDKRTK